MFDINPYTSGDFQAWNDFVGRSKNATFLHDRRFMDYHSDRFQDSSLMVYRRGKLFALLPASAFGEQVQSHGGLTYGGLLLDQHATAEDVLELFSIIKDHFKARGFKELIYAPTPSIYHKLPAQEDLYALFRNGAQIVGCQPSSVIEMQRRLPFRCIRKSGAKKAEASKVEIIESDDFVAFWEVLTSNLQGKYNVAPVHTLEEIQLLHSRFPKQIRLHQAVLNGQCLAGVVMFLTERVAHVQYISASPGGKETGALDLLFSVLINEVYTDYPYFDFGTSSEQNGLVLNSPLIYQKEGFGARTVVYTKYRIALC